MQYFDRKSESPPEYLRDEKLEAYRFYLANFFSQPEESLHQTRVPDPIISLNDPSIRLGVANLFHGKCAFCERKTDTRAHYFRPPAEAHPMDDRSVGHLYYCWLSSAWENIYPICRDCFPEDPYFFPVEGKRAPLPTPTELATFARENLGSWRHYPPDEDHVLIDPCRSHDFATHFAADVNGEMVAGTPAGQTTLQHYRLNRSELVKQRQRLFNLYLQDLPEFIDQYRARMSGEFRSMEFGGLWYLVLRRSCRGVAANFGLQLTTTRAGIGKSLRRIFSARALREDFYRQIASPAGFDALVEKTASAPRVQSTETEYRSSGYPGRLQRAQIRNFKGLEKLEFTVRGPVNSEKTAPGLLVLGENATGKSTMLEAICLAACDREARDGLGLDVQDLMLNPEYIGQPNAEPRDAAISLRFGDKGQRRLSIDSRGMRVTGGSGPPVFAYGAFRHYSRGERDAGPSQAIETLFKTETLISNPEKWLLGLDEPEFDDVVRALRLILTVEGEFDVIERDKAKGRCLIVSEAPGMNGEGHRLKTPLQEVSSGFRAILAMVCDIARGLMDRSRNPQFESLATSRALVLIDEIEAHLHPRWKMQIMGALRQAFPEITFIVTTHDPLCLRGMRDGEVMVLHRVASHEADGDTDLPVMVEKLVDLPDVSNLTIEQLLTSDLFSLYSTDSPETEGKFEDIASLLAREGAGEPLSEGETQALAKFRQEISAVLPVGSTEAQRLVQTAVAEYLKKRREAGAHKLREMKESTRKDIVRILEQY